MSPIVLMVDGYPVHPSKKVMNYIASLEGRLKIVCLPPYEARQKMD